MGRYVLRRLLHAIPILIGVNALTFALFFVVNPPERMARRILGEKNVTPAMVKSWLADHEYDRPLFFNPAAGIGGGLAQTVFFQKSVRLFWFRFGTSDRNNLSIGDEIRQRMGPSLAITVPMFLLGLAADLTVALLVAWCRATYFDLFALVVSVLAMSISTLFYIVGGQWAMAKLLHLAPISGYEAGFAVLRFTWLPVLIGVVAGMGGGVRFYRTIFLEELGRDYVRTARAKGVGELGVLFVHVLKNAMIPILTGSVTELLFLFLGSLLLESFFAIPGLGGYLIEAIQAQDFAVVRSMVFLGSVLYLAGLILTDVGYAVVDPRVRFE